jgi:hypothetical protein
MHNGRRVRRLLTGNMRRKAWYGICAAVLITAFSLSPTAASAVTANSSTVSASAAFSCTANLPPQSPPQFWRCNGSAWIGVGAYNITNCASGNYNAGTVFTVRYNINGCNDRVWLHQYTNYTNGHGWSYCISPAVLWGAKQTPSQYVNPENIQITTNTANC